MAISPHVALLRVRLVGAFSASEHRVEHANGNKASYVVVAFEARVDDGATVNRSRE